MRSRRLTVVRGALFHMLMTVLIRWGYLAGVGIAQHPTMMVWKDIQAGRMIHALPQWRPRSGIIHAAFPFRRGLLTSVRALLDFLADEGAA